MNLTTSFREFWRARRKSISLNKPPLLTPFGFQFSGNELMAKGDFEPEESTLVISELQTFDVMVDIGANIGYYTCLALQHKKKVFAFEPHPDNLFILYKNLAINNWTKTDVFPFASGSTNGISMLKGDGTGASLLDGWGGDSSSKQMFVPVQRLDEVLSNRLDSRSRVFFKVDIEGSEFDALQGARNRLSHPRNSRWLVEIAFDTQISGGFNYRYVDTFDLFFRNGFRAFTANRSRKELHLRDIKEFAACRAKPAHVSNNYFFVRDS
jgi:FkbM family methyltransferase